MQTTVARLGAAQTADKVLCTGIDPDIRKLPEHIIAQSDEDVPLRHPLYLFGQEVIAATIRPSVALKFNAAFFERCGWQGIRAMQNLRSYCREIAPSTPITYDAKRGDIGNTNLHYGHAIFERFGFDAVTIHNYVGWDGGMDALVEQYPDKLFYVLCRTSNPGAREFQDRIDSATGLPAWQLVAFQVAEQWNKHGNCGLVVGATYPDDLRWIRNTFGPNLPILAPGIGTQGANPEQAVLAGKGMTVYNVSSAIIHASQGKDFATRANARARGYDNQFSAILSNLAN